MLYISPKPNTEAKDIATLIQVGKIVIRKSE